jgi:catechol 2,3-dioxygenase-like lactoylglutathione lyase family enzyme
MTPLSLWIPFEVPDLEAAVDFWERRLGLRRVEEWNDDSENALVLEATPGSLLEFVCNADGRTGIPAGLTIALELPTWANVDAEYQRLVSPATVAAGRSSTSDPSAPSASSATSGASASTGALAAGPPRVYPRGYYAFRLTDPHGIQVLIWSEAPSAGQRATMPASPADGSAR